MLERIFIVVFFLVTLVACGGNSNSTSDTKVNAKVLTTSDLRFSILNEYDLSKTEGEKNPDRPDFVRAQSVFIVDKTREISSDEIVTLFNAQIRDLESNDELADISTEPSCVVRVEKARERAKISLLKLAVEDVERNYGGSIIRGYGFQNQKPKIAQAVLVTYSTCQ